MKTPDADGYTVETCLECQNPEATVRHGICDSYYSRIHLWYCPDCGHSVTVLLYDCPECALVLGRTYFSG